MTAPETLKPCLRCEGQIVIIKHTEGRIGVHIPPTLFAWCCTTESCRIRSNDFTSRTATIEHANRRPTPTPIPEEATCGAIAGTMEKVLDSLKKMPQDVLERLLATPLGDVGQFIMDTGPTPSEGLTPPDYDKAVEALAPYLPDGWYMQHSSGSLYRSLPNKPVVKNFGAGSTVLEFWSCECGLIAGNRLEGLNLPVHSDWRTSLRRIEKGKVAG